MDPYKTLGVSRTASDSDIKSAFRKLAKKYHPDLNPGDTKTELRFKDVNAAYHILSDNDRRAKYDRGDIDSAGREQRSGGGGFWRNWAGGSRRTADPFDIDHDVFEEFFKANSSPNRNTRKPGPGAGSPNDRLPGDVTYNLTVPFMEAAGGINKRVTLSDGRSLDLKVPPGTEDGQTLRLKGQGRRVGSRTGDAFIEITVSADDLFSRDGQNLTIDAPITLYEAVLGGSITVPTVHGKVTLKIPEGSNSDKILRLRGKGMPAKGELAAGDQLVRLKIMLPEEMDKSLIDFVRKWQKDKGYNPRHKRGF
jgi:DnaJ-class molecular chaperone